ncbi:MAG: ABC transporter, partial [Deltaproteobacteria bacterium CG_4_10_14_3_um_filter_60_8]
MTAVDEVSFVVQQGEFIFIHGHSGSGKTTLLSLIGGLTSPDTGQVLIDGQDNWQQSDNALSDMRNRTIGFIFQFASLIPALTVLENILLPMSFGGLAAGARERAEQLLVQVGLKEKMHSYPGQLSGGQQRRVAIARAFINQPA